MYPVPSGNKDVHYGFETSLEVQKKGISGPTERTYFLQNIKKKNPKILSVKKPKRSSFFLLPSRKIEIIHSLPDFLN